MKLCRRIEEGGTPYDLSEFEEMLDLYGDMPLLDCKPSADEHGPAEAPMHEGKRLPVDLEAMRYKGNPGMNDTFLGYMGSRLSKGETIADIIEQVVEVAERSCANDPNRSKWRHDLATKATWWLEKHEEWVNTALNRDNGDAWYRAEGKKRRIIWKNGRGIEIRSWGGTGSNDQQPEKGPEPKPDTGRRRRPVIFSSLDFTAGFVPTDYLIDGMVQLRFLYSLTGPTGHGKTGVLLLIAAHVALERPLGGRTVAGGHVIILVGENPDDVRMRWIAMAEHVGFDPATINVHFLPGVYPIREMQAEIEKRAREIDCQFALVIVDTSAAYFTGAEENSNVQLGKHARELRTLVEMPGGPCVTSRATRRRTRTSKTCCRAGGGAFLAEVDGNLICSKTSGEDVTEVHWHGKFRGPDFNPLAFELRQVTAARLVDSKGKPIPTVLALPLDEVSHSSKRAESRAQEDELLMLLLAGNEGLSLTAVAEHAGWISRTGEPNKSKAQRVMNRLRDAHLVKNERGDWRLTEAGEKAAKKAAERGQEQRCQDT